MGISHVCCVVSCVAGHDTWYLDIQDKIKHMRNNLPVKAWFSQTMSLSADEDIECSDAEL